jgi:glutathione S-transferase
MRLYDYLASCNCYKVRLLLAQLGQPYERVPIDIFDGDTLTDEYRHINPSRTTPVLETDDGCYLPESNAILVYLADGTPFWPDDPWELAQVMRWLIYEQTDVIPTMGGLRFRLLVGRLLPSDPDAIRRKKGALEVLQLLDDHLATREFFVGGRYTIAELRSTATRTWRTRPASTWSRIPTCALGSSASRHNRTTSRTSSRTAPTRRPARDVLSTTRRSLSRSTAAARARRPSASSSRRASTSALRRNACAVGCS